MTNVQIRDVPQETVDVLRTRAAAEGLSLTAYLRKQLESMAAQPTLAELISQADRWRHEGTHRSTLAAATREVRDERS